MPADGQAPYVHHRARRHDFTRFARVALDLLRHTPPLSLATGSDGLVLHRAAIHQTAGILSVHLGASIDAALPRLRAHAWHHDLPQFHVARAVFTGRLHLDPDG
ncbi:ANTAR domain-containing protein [Streptomyces chrestomyceticus]|uniref:ANTAR domain-containing protein n=1 Tax=Streptomyces chrestomyceticus TaxID=68185 RepID=UPI0037B3CA83